MEGDTSNLQARRSTWFWPPRHVLGRKISSIPPQHLQDSCVQVHTSTVLQPHASPRSLPGPALSCATGTMCLQACQLGCTRSTRPWRPHPNISLCTGSTSGCSLGAGSTYQSLDFPHSSGPKWNTPVFMTYCLKMMSSSALLFLQ